MHSLLRCLTQSRRVPLRVHIWLSWAPESLSCLSAFPPVTPVSCLLTCHRSWRSGRTSGVRNFCVCRRPWANRSQCVQIYGQLLPCASSLMRLDTEKENGRRLVKTLVRLYLFVVSLTTVKYTHTHCRLLESCCRQITNAGTLTLAL